MRAHVIENGVVVNTIEVESLDFMPGLVDAESGGSIGDRYENGEFIKYDPKTDPVATKAKADAVREERNSMLSASDWTQLSDSPADTLSWATYRQALRDVTAQAGFPWDIAWPEKPTV